MNPFIYRATSRNSRPQQPTFEQRFERLTAVKRMRAEVAQARAAGDRREAQRVVEQLADLRRDLKAGIRF